MLACVRWHNMRVDNCNLEKGGWNRPLDKMTLEQGPKARGSHVDLEGVCTASTKALSQDQARCA